MTRAFAARHIDLNCDMGEIPALVTDGTQELILAHVTSVNVACGAHAGDEATIEATIRAALRHGCAVGAHPGYPDRDNFGRRVLPLSFDEVVRTVAEQVTFVAGIAARCGARLSHVKPHGALYNAAADDRALAAAIAAGVARARRDAGLAVDDLVLVGLAGSACLEVYAAEGFRTAPEAFADRRYEPDGTLRSRSYVDALLTDPEEAATQALRLARDAEAVAVGGAVVTVRAATLCLHGDTPGAPSIAAAVAARLRAAGIEPRPWAPESRGRAVPDAKEARVIIVGAGLAGLACARRLAGGPAPPLILEAANGVGGRTRTDVLEGFRLDRGFHLFLAAFPEARNVLDYQALNLKPFAPEAYIRFRGRFHHVADPRRRPSVALMALGRPIGSLADKVRLGLMSRRLLRGSLEALLARPETTTLEALRAANFSASMIDRLFRPLFGGVLLDRDLGVSSRAFEFLFRMMAEDDACLPSAGIGAIPNQIAAALPEGTVRLNAPVSQVAPGRVLLRSGEELRAAAIVIATEQPEAARLLGAGFGRGTGSGGGAPGGRGAPAGRSADRDRRADGGRGARGVTCLHFAAARAPFPEPIVVLDADGEGPIDTLAVISNVAPARAPAGSALVAATMIGVPRPGDPALEPAARRQMELWFGRPARDWRLLRIDRIPFAHPNQDPPALDPPQRPVKVRPGLYVCGDHVDNASIDGALTSGRRAAEAVLADLGRRG